MNPLGRDDCQECKGSGIADYDRDGAIHCHVCLCGACDHQLDAPHGECVNPECERYVAPDAKEAA